MEGKTGRIEWALDQVGAGKGSSPSVVLAGELHNLLADIQDLVLILLEGRSLPTESHTGALVVAMTAPGDMLTIIQGPLSRDSSSTARVGARYVASKPWLAVRTAAVCGLLLGVRVGRRE